VTQTIARIYESSQHAAQAAKDLLSMGVPETAIHLLPNPGGSKTEAVAAMTDALLARHVLRANAVSYANEVVQGGAILSVYAPFGTAKRVLRVMDSHNPTGPAGFDLVSSGLPAWNERLPFSSAFFNWPVLYQNPTPFASFWHVPTLIDNATSLSGRFGWKLLSDKAYTFANWKMLSDKATPLSDTLSWKTLSANQFTTGFLPLLTSIKEFMNPPALIDAKKWATDVFPLLTSKQTILDMWPTLSAKIAPLSSAMSWPLLTERKQMFASWPQLIHTDTLFPSLISGTTAITGRWKLLTKTRFFTGTDITLSSDPAPLSSKLSWPVLSKAIAPLSEALAWPVLSARQVTISTLPTIVNHPSPLSHVFACPTLLNPSSKP
jgi:hypothetical protein